MRKFYSIIILTLLTFSPTLVYAEETTVSDILGDQEINNEIIAELDTQEEAREDGFENQLLLQIPELTDNPSHIITFTDPSEEKVGVQLEIDNTKYDEISTPYALPALGIGTHELKFKFTDNQGATQILEKELTIIPRPPIINTPQITQDTITISGTGLANSQIILLLTSGSYNTTKTVDIDSDGIWKNSFSIENKTNTLYSVSAYTRKYGFASNLSEVLNFNTDNSVVTTRKSTTIPEIVFSIESLADPVAAFSKNLDFTIYTVIILIIGAILSLGLTSLKKNGKEATHLKAFKEKIDKKVETSTNSNNLTLREKLSQNIKSAEKASDKKSDSNKTDEKEESVIPKDQFMKDFKNFDPDNKKGKEKKVKISLTSKDN